jgi:hypothetical protein
VYFEPHDGILRVVYASPDCKNQRHGRRHVKKQTYTAIGSIERCQDVLAGSRKYDVAAKYGFGELSGVEWNADELGVPVDDANFGLVNGTSDESEYGQREQTL